MGELIKLAIARTGVAGLLIGLLVGLVVAWLAVGPLVRAVTNWPMQKGNEAQEAPRPAARDIGAVIETSKYLVARAVADQANGESKIVYNKSSGCASQLVRESGVWKENELHCSERLPFVFGKLDTRLGKEFAIFLTDRIDVLLINLTDRIAFSSGTKISCPRTRAVDAIMHGKSDVMLLVTADYACEDFSLDGLTSARTRYAPSPSVSERISPPRDAGDIDGYALRFGDENLTLTGVYSLNRTIADRPPVERVDETSKGEVPRPDEAGNCSNRAFPVKLCPKNVEGTLVQDLCICAANL